MCINIVEMDQLELVSDDLTIYGPKTTSSGNPEQVAVEARQGHAAKISSKIEHICQSRPDPGLDLSHFQYESL